MVIVGPATIEQKSEILACMIDKNHIHIKHQNKNCKKIIATDRREQMSDSDRCQHLVYITCIQLSTIDLQLQKSYLCTFSNIKEPRSSLKITCLFRAASRFVEERRPPSPIES